jgi:hypothetical protein
LVDLLRFGTTMAFYATLMHLYKITFVKNKIDSCRVGDEIVMEGNFTYQKHNGFLIYMLVKAESESKAREKATELIERISLYS